MLTENLRDVIESDISSDACRLWLWLFLEGKLSIADILRSELPNIVPALNVLASSGRLKVDGVRMSAKMPEAVAVSPMASRRKGKAKVSPRFSGLGGMERVRTALKASRIAGAQKIINDGCDRVFRAYNTERLARGMKPVAESQREGQRKKWRKILVLASEDSAPISEMMAFAYDATRFQGTKFPSPAIISGPWFRSAWLDRGTAQEAHAGHTYEAPDVDVKTKLRNAGHDFAAGLDAAALRHVVKLAETERSVPHMRKRHKDPQIEAAIMFLANEGGD